MTNPNLPISNEGTTGVLQNPDLMPLVSCDIALGRLVTSIEVDADYFARFMAQSGVSEDEIGKTSIVVTAQTIERKGAYVGIDDETIGFGHYEPPTKTAYIHLGSLKSSLVFYSHTSWEDNMPADLYDSLGTSFASSHLLHELGHRIVHASGDEWFKDELEYFRNIVPEKLRNRILRNILRRFSSPSAHKLAELNRDFEIMKGMDKRGTIEHYQGSPSEQMAESYRQQAENELPAGYYPVRVSFLQK